MNEWTMKSFLEEHDKKLLDEIKELKLELKSVLEEQEKTNKLLIWAMAELDRKNENVNHE